MKRAVMIVACAGLLLGAAAGRAFEPLPFAADRQAAGPGRPPPAVAREDSLELKSPGKAARLSLLWTLVPLVGGVRLSDTERSGGEIAGAVAAAAVLVGPSVGYFYGGCGGRGTVGIAIRVGLTGVGLVAAAQAEWPSLWGSDEEGNAAAGITVLAFSAVVADMALDLARVSATVRRANDRRLRERSGPTLTPTVRVLAGSGAPACGFTVRF